MSGVSNDRKRKSDKCLLSMELGDCSEESVKPHKNLRSTVGTVKNPEDILWLSDYYLLKVYKDFLNSRVVSYVSFDIDQLNNFFNIRSRSKIKSGSQRSRRIDLEGGKSAVLWAQVCDDYSGQKLYVGVTSNTVS